MDDDAPLRRVLSLALTAFGYQVVEAASGDEAMESLRSDSYDAVLLDIDMPGMDGIDICRKIQGLHLRPAVLMLTVHQGKDYRARAFAAGAVDYITKPFYFRDLVEHIEAAVRSRSALS